MIAATVSGSAPVLAGAVALAMVGLAGRSPESRRVNSTRCGSSAMASPQTLRLDVSASPPTHAAIKEFGSTKKLVEETQLTAAQMRLALAYRDAHPAEVDEAIADNRRPLDELRMLFPFIEVVDA
jgi:hypothetical protein